VAGHGDRQHARFGGSGAYRWLRCTMSPRMIAAVPPLPPSNFALDGTEAHELLDLALRSRIRSAEVAFMTFLPKWQYREDSYSVRIKSVQTALDHVFSIIDTFDRVDVYVETAFKFPLPFAFDEAWGTTDVMIYVPWLGWLFIVDFKHGAGDAVEAEDNEQLMFYGAGGAKSLQGRIDCVTLQVVQPRAYHPDGPVRTWNTDLAGLAKYEERVASAIQEAQGDKAKYAPSAVTCKYCDAKLVCPAYEQLMQNVMGSSPRQANLVDVSALSLPELGRLLAGEELIRAYFRQAKDRAYAEAMRGAKVPGFKVVESQGRRQWDLQDPTPRGVAQTAEWLAGETGANPALLVSHSMATITEVEDEMKRALHRTGRYPTLKAAAEAARLLLDNYTLKDNRDANGNIQYTLAPETDPRPEVNRAQAMFANVVTLAPPGK